MPTLNIRNPLGKGEIIKIDQSQYDFLVAKKDGTESFSIDVNGLPDTTCNQQYYEETVNIGDIAADSDAITPLIFKKPQAVTIAAIWMGVDTTVGADAVNYQTVDVKRTSDDATILSSAPNTTAGLTAGTPVTMGTIAAEGALTADNSLYLDFTKTASGKALSGFTLHIIYTLEA